MPNYINLDDNQLSELKVRLKSEKNAIFYKRLKVIDLKNQGLKNVKISSELQMHPTQVGVWIKTFLEEGFEPLCRTNYSKTKPMILDPYLNEVKTFVDEKSPTSQEVANYICDKYSIKVCENAVSNFLKKRLNYSYKKKSNSWRPSR